MTEKKSNETVKERKEKSAETAKKTEKKVERFSKENEEITKETKPESKEDKKTINETKNQKKSDNKEKKKPKTEAVVNSQNAHLSTKTSAAVCKFIVGKTIDQATNDLKEVIAMKKPVPMKGEIPHRKGKIMSGRFPKNAAKHFIVLLKTLAGNANVNGLEEPIIAEAIANIGNRPYGKFGTVRRKRTHIKIITKNRSSLKKIKNKSSKKQKEKKE